MTHPIAFMTGSWLLIIGISYLLNAEDWRRWMISLRDGGRQSSLLLGIIILFIGSLIVGFHWQWEGRQMILTVVGLLTMVKGAVYVLFPGWLPAKIGWIEPRAKVVMPIAGLLVITLGLMILSL